MLFVKFYAPRWGMENVPWARFLEMVKSNGFQGIEVYPLRKPEEKQEMLKGLAARGLEFSLIHTVSGPQRNFKEYVNAMEENLYTLVNYQSYGIKPEFITSQTGREYYTKEQMAICFDICDRISREAAIPIIQETHRNKWSYAAHIVKEYLNDFPLISLALDFSHWVCVSESYLEDQQDAVELAINHGVHLHARVGHPQGPQVTDPRAPENAEALKFHLQWWDQWISRLIEKGIRQCSITPEFGPYPYMSYLSFTTIPVSNQWEINCYMKDMLTRRYREICDTA